MEATTLAVMTEQQLRTLIDEVIERTISGREPQQPSYLTRKEASEKLRISLPTLDDYTKRGLLNCSQIGRRKLYSLTEIEAAAVRIDGDGGLRYKRRI